MVIGVYHDFEQSKNRHEVTIFWLRDPDSNRESPGYGPGEMPISLSRAKLVYSFKLLWCVEKGGFGSVQALSALITPITI